MKDLFEDWDELPQDLREVLEANYTDEATCEDLHDIQQKVEKLGYTFDYDFSGSAYALRPIGVALNEVEGFED